MARKAETMKRLEAFGFGIALLVSLPTPCTCAEVGDPGAFVRQDVSCLDGCESLPENPARGPAPGGWTVFKPEGLPKWHGQGGFRSSLWELSRFSGGREQNGKRPLAERVGGKDVPISEPMKADVRRFLAETREKGGSLIVRLGYTWSDQQGCEPSDFSVLLGHVRDLSRILAGFPDVVVGVEAGVAGPWGEMHSSDYCKKEYITQVLNAYLEHLAPTTPVLVRAPAYLEHMDFNPRLGMYNDGYLGTWWDYGTWAGKFTREKGCELLKPRHRVPYGGELAYIGRDFLDENKHRCAELWDPAKWNIVRDWYDVHLSYLRNLHERGHTLATYLAEVRFDSKKWAYEGMPRLAEYDGATMSKFVLDHMGYRFVVRGVRVSSKFTRGQPAVVALGVENTGFGSLLVKDRSELLFVSGQTSAAVPVDVAFAEIPGGGRKKAVLRFEVPCALAPGTYELCLRTTAGTSPLRLANAGMWREETKANSLGNVTVR